MNDYNKITALYSRLSVGDEDRDGGESNSIQNQKIFLENYARGQRLTNIRHYIDDDESGRFFDRSAYSRMMEDVENGKIGVCIMKDLTRWGRDYLQVGNAMEIFRRNNVRFIAVNNGIDSEKPDTLEFAPFINIMSEWYAKDISKKVKTGIKTKGMSGKPIATEAPYGYVKDPDNKDFWIIDEEAAEVVRLIFRLFIGGKNRNQIAVYLKNEQIPTPTFYMKDRGRGTCKNKALNEDNRYKWNKATLTHILTRQEYCGDVVNFKTTKHFRDKRNHYVDRSQWQITENVHEPIIDRADFETAQRILENAPVRRPNGDGEIHPLSGLLFCKDCGAKMHIRIDYRNGGKRHVAYCSEYHKGKAKNPKCHSPHIIDADLLMHDFDTSMFFRWIFKSAFAILIVSNTWNIVMGVFDATQSVVNQSSGVIIGETSIHFDRLIPGLEFQLESMTIGSLLSLWFQTLVVGLTMNILSICIFLVTYGRIIEIYVVTALGPIPLATMGSSEWRSTGQNYLKSLLALGFQAFLIMIVVGIYAVLIRNISGAADIAGAIWGCMGYTVLLCFCLFKTGSISKSVFGAH